MKRWYSKIKIAGGVALGALVLVLIGLVLTGLYVGWGPFTYLQFDRQEKAILEKYPTEQRTGEIVFYGASNFRLWTEMENDLDSLKVQNHGFGGSTDAELVKRADKLLYPYAPKIVVFQTGSNDYVGLPGTKEEQAAACIEGKREMFAEFHEKLPEAKFIVMSGLLLPGRSQYTALTEMVNHGLEQMCMESNYLYFAGASTLTYNGTNYVEELFIDDGIHLNHDGQLRWCKGYIRPMLESLIEIFHMDDLRKDT